MMLLTIMTILPLTMIRHWKRREVSSVNSALHGVLDNGGERPILQRGLRCRRTQTARALQKKRAFNWYWLCVGDVLSYGVDTRYNGKILMMLPRRLRLPVVELRSERLTKS